jgi:hypothetical protein
LLSQSNIQERPKTLKNPTLLGSPLTSHHLLEGKFPAFPNSFGAIFGTIRKRCQHYFYFGIIDHNLYHLSQEKNYLTYLPAGPTRGDLFPQIKLAFFV